MYEKFTHFRIKKSILYNENTSVYLADLAQKLELIDTVEGRFVSNILVHFSVLLVCV